MTHKRNFVLNSSYSSPFIRIRVFVYSCIRGIRRFSEIVVFLFISLYHIVECAVDGTEYSGRDPVSGFYKKFGKRLKF